MLEPPSSKILHMTFSGDGTTLTGSNPDTCFHFSLDIPETPEKLDYGPNMGATTVARLGRSSLVAFVSINMPRKLRIMNMSKNAEICSHNYTDSVLGVRLNQFKMIVCLANRIYIHDTRTTSLEHVINTSPNPRGLLAVTDGEDELFLLAFPNSAVKGEVQIFDGVSHETKRVVLAHELPVACLQLNGSGTLLATASVEGCHILVFNLSDGVCLHKFHRGIRCADIYYINFSKDDAFLSVSSSKPTIHIFKLNNNDEDQMCSSINSPINNSKLMDKPNDSEETNKTDDKSDYYSLDSWIVWAKSSIVPILPTHISESLFGDNGSFATIRLPYSDEKSIITVSTSYTENGPEPRVIVAAYDGWIYIYKLNKDEGGECELLKQVQLFI